jgi:excisionase family DNA binding protein
MNNAPAPEQNPFAPRVKIGFPDIPESPELKALHEAQLNLMKNLIREVLATFKPPAVETILPLAEAARALHVQPITLRRMVQANKIGYLWDGKGYFFKVSDLNDYLEKHYTPAKPRDASGDHWENSTNI